MISKVKGEMEAPHPFSCFFGLRSPPFQQQQGLWTVWKALFFRRFPSGGGKPNGFSTGAAASTAAGPLP